MELKACPFCGSEAVWDNGDNDLATCPEKGCPGRGVVEPMVIWNHRPIEDALQKRVEELEMSIKEAVKEIDNMRDFEPEDQIDTEWLHAVMRVLDILRKHGLVED